MAWFKVDDKFHSHSKIRKVLADDPAALALWVVAGSWSSDNLTDGFVPDHQLPWLIPTGTDELARKLVSARLWRRVRGGHQIHDFTDWNMTAEEVLERRAKRSAAGAKGGKASAKTRKEKANEKKVHVDEASSSEQDLSDEGASSNGTNGAPKADIEPGTSTDSEANAEASATASAQANAKQKRTPTRPGPTHSSSKEELPPQPSASGGAAKRGTRLPDDFELTAERLAWAKARCPLVNVEYEYEQFCSYWRARAKDNTKLDWDETFKVWVRKEQKTLEERFKPKPGNRLTGADSRNGATNWDDPNLLDNLLDY